MRFLAMKRVPTLLATLALAACSTPSKEDSALGMTTTTGASGAMALFPILDAEAGPGENIVYSPASVDQAFGLLHIAARGDTSAELERILPAPRSAKFLQSNEKDVEVRLANALFLSDAFEINRSFVETAERRYDATTQSVDFRQAQQTAETINDWADEATDGLIPEVMTPDAIKPEMIAVLANALYFDGKWQTKLKSQQQKPFLFGDRRDEDFQFVGEILSLPLVREGDWTAVRLPYRNERYVMDVIMPQTRKIMDEAPSPAVISRVADALADADEVMVDFLIPQFEVDYSAGLIPTLKALGLTAPFTDGVADLSGIAASGQRNIVVSDVRHVTKLQVFDEGTRAAAVTTISIILTAGRTFEKKPETFHADRPFMIVIRDLEADAILFVGRISDPQPFEPVVEEM